VEKLAIAPLTTKRKEDLGNKETIKGKRLNANKTED
jgi:hypothetical protein